MSPVYRLKQWADQKRHDRLFNIRYLPAAAPAPWAVDLENHATQAAVHEETHETLGRAIEWALREAAKEPAL
jgi:hypothetical protein